MWVIGSKEIEEVVCLDGKAACERMAISSLPRTIYNREVLLESRTPDESLEAANPLLYSNVNGQMCLRLAFTITVVCITAFYLTYLLFNRLLTYNPEEH